MIFHANCQSLGVPVGYHEQEARHVWTFWDGELRWFLGRCSTRRWMTREGKTIDTHNTINFHIEQGPRGDLFHHPL